jgi:ABC-type multidrug transport system ATPase subunit
LTLLTSTLYLFIRKWHFHSMSEPVISISGLCKAFGKKPVLSGVDLQLDAGSVFGLVGLNGAGKTTLIRLLLGLLKPDSGSISALSFNPWKHQPEYFRNLGVVLENDGFFGNLDFSANIDFYSRAKGISRDAVSRYLSETWSGQEITQSDKQVKQLSRGQRMQCALCRAFLGWPTICFLDEPSITLDVKAYDHFCGLARTAKSKGSTILISSHQLSTIEELCDRVGILENGMVTVLDTSSQNDSRRHWSLIADRDEKYGAIIQEIAHTKPAWENGTWQFVVQDPNSTIPEIVTSLVKVGCKIREIKPEESDLREIIRKVYK